MFPYRRDLPKSILKKLAKQRTEARSGLIPRNNFGRLPDFAARRNDAVIQFIVLTAHKFRVEPSDSIQRGFVPASVGYATYGPFVVRIPEFRTAYRERHVKRMRDGFRNIAVGARQRRTADIVGTGLLEHLD